MVQIRTKKRTGLCHPNPIIQVKTVFRCLRKYQTISMQAFLKDSRHHNLFCERSYFDSCLYIRIFRYRRIRKTTMPVYRDNFFPTSKILSKSLTLTGVKSSSTTTTPCLCLLLAAWAGWPQTFGFDKEPWHTN